MKLGNLINKNFRILLRSKIGALIVLVGPLLVVLLVGTGFSSSSLHNLQVGVYSSGYNEFTDSLVQTLEDKEYVVIKVDSLEACTVGVETGDYHVCAVFPENLEAGVTEESIDFYVDYSRVNLVHLIISDLSSKISTKSSEISLSHTQNLLDVLTEARDNVVAKRDIIASAKEKESTIYSKVDTITSGSGGLDTSFDDLQLKVEELNNLTEQMGNDTALCGACNYTGPLGDAASDIDTLLASISGSLDSISSEASSIQTISAENTQTLGALIVAIDGLSDKINIVQITQAEGIVSPLKTEIKSISSEEGTHWHYLFPTLVSIIIMFVGIILAATLVVREKKSKAYFRNFITPTSDFTFLISVFLTCIIILFIQLAIIFAHAYYVIGEALFGVLANASLVLFVSGSVFVFLGMAIGYISRSEEITVLTSVSIAAIMLFFSNTILPIESTIASFQKIAAYNPYVITEILLKKVIFFKEILQAVSVDLLNLVVILAILFVLAFSAREISKRRV